MKNNIRCLVILLFLITHLLGNRAESFEWNFFKFLVEEEPPPIQQNVPPVPAIVFIPYSNCQYDVELNLANLDKDKYKYSQPAISPDKRHMIYTEIVFIPSTHQVASKLIYIPLPPLQEDSLTGEPAIPLENIERYNIKSPTTKKNILLSLNYDNAYREQFRTITVVDWSQDSTKVILKDKIGIHQKGIVQTNLWLYDLPQNKLVLLQELREAIIYDIRQKKHINLENVNWDLAIAGFAQESNSTKIIVEGLVYQDKTKPPNHLGFWSYDLLNRRLEYLGLQFDRHQLECNALTIEK